jgi:hypothetical protein
MRGTVAAIGIAAVIAAAGGAAIYAATGHSGAWRPTFAGQMPPGPPPPGAGGFDTPLALHGEFAVGDGMGGFTTVLTQNGAVTAMSANTITVHSADGYTQTYLLPPGARAAHPVALDDEVELRAKRTGETATVTTLTERVAGAR